MVKWLVTLGSGKKMVKILAEQQTKFANQYFSMWQLERLLHELADNSKNRAFE